MYEDGEATIQCGEYSTTVTVQEKGGGTYSSVLENFDYLIKSGEVILGYYELKNGTVLTENNIFNLKSNYEHYGVVTWKIPKDMIEGRSLIVDPVALNGITLGFIKDSTYSNILVLSCLPNKVIGKVSNLDYFKGISITEDNLKTEFSWQEIYDKLENPSYSDIIIYFTTNYNGGGPANNTVQLRNLYIK